MRLIDLGSVNPLRALACEEAVLEALDAGRAEPTWFLWTSAAPCAVLGTARPAEGDLELEALRAAGVPVLRRRSGGGTVLLGPPSPAVTLVTESPGDIRESYEHFYGLLVAAFARLGVEAEFRPPADLAVGDRKIAGLAQRRKRRGVLVTASVLAAPLVDESARWLAEPAGRDAPAYRGGRRHAEFMTSLAGLGVERAAERFAEELIRELSDRGAAQGALSTRELARAAEIERELADPDWIFRF